MALSVLRHGYACSKWLSPPKPPNIYYTMYLLATGRVQGSLGRNPLLISSVNQVYLLISLPGGSSFSQACIVGVSGSPTHKLAAPPCPAKMPSAAVIPMDLEKSNWN